MANDLTQAIIQQQIALNSDSISISNVNGSYQFVNSNTGQPLTQKTASVGSFVLANTPGMSTKIIYLRLEQISVI